MFLLVLIMLFVCPQSNLAAQDWYSGREAISCDGQNYSVKHLSAFRGYLVSNDNNKMRRQPRYKVGSKPCLYYSEATGMGHMAELDSCLFYDLVERVFSKEEILHYTANPGYVLVRYVVDSNVGHVLEVDFTLFYRDDDKTILSLPPDKLVLLEKLLKEEMTCGISSALKEERQSYAITNNFLFLRPKE